jgi:hypothetical protein
MEHSQEAAFAPAILCEAEECHHCRHAKPRRWPPRGRVANDAAKQAGLHGLFDYECRNEQWRLLKSRCLIYPLLGLGVHAWPDAFKGFVDRHVFSVGLPVFEPSSFGPSSKKPG